MTAAGWTFLLVSWGAILALCGFCFWKIMTSTRENIHAPLDIDTDEHDEHAGAGTRGTPAPPRGAA
jgi:hypothetical protein